MFGRKLRGHGTNNFLKWLWRSFCLFSACLIVLFKNMYIYLLLAVPGLRCCVGCSLVVATRGYSLVAVHELFIAVAFCRTAGSRTSGLQWSWLLGSEAQAQEWRTGLDACSMWGISRSGIESVSPELAGGLLTTEPSGKPCSIVLISLHLSCKQGLPVLLCSSSLIPNSTYYYFGTVHGKKSLHERFIFFL